MPRRSLLYVGLIALTGACSASPPAASIAGDHAPSALRFEANVGQTDPEVKFLARAEGYTAFLTRDALVLRFTPRASLAAHARPAVPAAEEVVRLRFAGANVQAEWQGRRPTEAVSHYLSGPDPSTWLTHVPTYEQVLVRDLYPGIDLLFLSRDGGLRYELIVHPGADARAAAFVYEGASRPSLDGAGNIVLELGLGGQLVQKVPRVIQEGTESSQISYHLAEDGSFAVEVKGYDEKKPVALEPELVFSTFFGGTGAEFLEDMDLDAKGNLYFAGWTNSLDFPVTPGVVQPAYGGGLTDVYVVKLRPDGWTVAYATYLGGSGTDQGLGLAVQRHTGHAFVTGETFSTDFPIVGALQSTRLGDSSAFVAELSEDGSSLIYSTYLGGASAPVLPPQTRGTSIDVDDAGTAWVGGTTTSDALPTTPGVVQPVYAGGPEDGFVARIAPKGAAFDYLTYVGGSSCHPPLEIDGNDDIDALAVDEHGNAVIGGVTRSHDLPVVDAFQPQHADLRADCNGGGEPSFDTVFEDAFVGKLNASGTAYIYLSYLGGFDTAIESDHAWGVVLDKAGNAYFAGRTNSPEFPITTTLTPDATGFPRGFVTKISSKGAFLASITLGAEDDVELFDVTLRKDRVVTIGTTRAAQVPVRDAVQSELSGPSDAVIFELTRDLAQLTFASYLGGSDDERGAAIVARPFSSSVYVGGWTTSPDFPLVNPLQSTLGGFRDAFIAELALGGKAFEAEFFNARGNIWWVESDVVANEELDGVDARVNGGEWRPLYFTPWESWADSFLVPSGSGVEFRARAVTGEVRVSAVYLWPQAEVVDPNGAFEATFFDERGNDWWVETDVDVTNLLAGVDARVDGGEWVELFPTPWGSWARSFFVEEGAIVELRARAVSGAEVIGAGLSWPP